MLGVPATAIRSIRDWRGDFASLSQSGVAHALRPVRPPSLHGPVLPAGAQAVSLAVTTHGRPVRLVLAVETRAGGFDHVALGDTAQGTTTLRARLPAADRGGRVIGLVVTLRFADAQALAHQGIEGGLTIVASGSLHLRPLRVGGTGADVTAWSGWITRGTARPAAPGLQAALRYALDGSTNGLFRPRQPTDGQAVPVIASPALATLAGRDGRLQMTAPDSETLTVRVAAVAQRFPTAGGAFVVAERGDTQHSPERR